MSQSRQSNATAAAGTSPEADTMVEAYAEDLMDDIFDDVDRILAGDEAAIYAEPPMPSESSLPMYRAEAVTVPAMIVPFTGEPAVEPHSAAPITETDPGSTESDNGQTSTSDQPSKKRSWRSWILGAAGLSAMAAMGIWWMRQQPTLQSVAPPVVPTTPTVSQETAFGEYLTRSLRVIGGERSAQAESQGTGVVAAAPPAPSSSPVTTGKPGVIERVFVPLLQPGTTARTPGNPPSTASIPSLPAPNAAPGQTAPAPSIAVASSYELVGVLELGDRSAALFEVDGSSQRVYIGETIGGSGWSIVSISNEEVVVRRNGEVRSIYIGQQF
ncbi:MAG: hypothetical protein AAFR24_03485 [Cyanobacteria bacterium J06627_3]